MIKEAIDKILDLEKIDLATIGDQTYVKANQCINRLKHPDEHAPNPLVFNTLTGLIDYLNCAIDPLDRSKLAYHVVDFNQVDLVGNLQANNENVRFCYARATCLKDMFAFNQWHPVEEFIINMQTHFEPTEQIEAIINLVGKIVSEHVKTQEDNGFTQVVQIRSGLTTKAEVKVENPVTVCPWRTFVEIDQPRTLAVLRFRQSRENDLQVALFDSACEFWRRDAIQAIKAWLVDKVGSVPVLA